MLIKPLALSLLTVSSGIAFGHYVTTPNSPSIALLGTGLATLNLGAFSIQSWINFSREFKAKLLAQLASGEIEWRKDGVGKGFREFLGDTVDVATDVKTKNITGKTCNRCNCNITDSDAFYWDNKCVTCWNDSRKSHNKYAEYSKQVNDYGNAAAKDVQENAKKLYKDTQAKNLENLQTLQNVLEKGRKDTGKYIDLTLTLDGHKSKISIPKDFYNGGGGMVL